MKKIILLISFCFLFFRFAFAQNPLVKQWDKRFGGNVTEVNHSIINTKDNGFLIGGYSTSGISGDKTQPSWGLSDYWIVKTDSLSNKQWDKRFGGNSTDLLFSLYQDSDGEYLLGGYSVSDSSGDKTEHNRDVNLIYADYWVVKIDSLGNKVWDKTFGGDSEDALESIIQAKDKGYILCGRSVSGISGDKTQASWGGTDGWVVKTDSVGNKLWDRRFGGSLNDNIYRVIETSDGGFLIGGISFSGISGDKTEMNWDSTFSTPDYWIIKLDSFGIKQWDKRYGGNNSDQLEWILQTVNGDYLLAGYSNSGLSGDKSQPAYGGTYDYWIIRLDNNGSKIWDKRFGGYSSDWGDVRISETADSGFFVAGLSYSPIGGDKSEANLGVGQTWMLKITNSGLKQCDKTVFTIGDDVLGSASYTNDSCYVVVNITDAGIGGYKSQPNWNNSIDYWLIKFCDSTLTSTTDIQSKISNFPIYPNPANNILTIQTPQFPIKNLKIFDTLGKEISISKNQISKNKNETQLNISSISSGIYLLRLTDEKGNFYSAKFVKK